MTTQDEKSSPNNATPTNMCYFKIIQGKLFISYIVGTKAKGRILKRSFQENEIRQISRKTNISYPWYEYVRVCVKG